jgi:hypothetical protein
MFLFAPNANRMATVPIMQREPYSAIPRLQAIHAIINERADL